MSSDRLWFPLPFNYYQQPQFANVENPLFILCHQHILRHAHFFSPEEGVIPLGLCNPGFVWNSMGYCRKVFAAFGVSREKFIEQASMAMNELLNSNLVEIRDIYGEKYVALLNFDPCKESH